MSQPFLQKWTVCQLYCTCSQCLWASDSVLLHHHINRKHLRDLSLFYWTFPCFLKDVNKSLLNFPLSQTILTAKNVVIATGGRPKFPVHVSKKHHTVLFFLCQRFFALQRNKAVGKGEKKIEVSACCRFLERQSTASPATTSSGWRSHQGKREHADTHTKIHTPTQANLRHKSVVRCRIYFRRWIWHRNSALCYVTKSGNTFFESISLSGSP